MRRRYAIADVFTDRMFSGNPVAVVLDAEGLTAARIQAIATEFSHSETTFVLPPRDPAHTAWVRIFTPSREVPLTRHPNIGPGARSLRLRGTGPERARNVEFPRALGHQIASLHSLNRASFHSTAGSDSGRSVTKWLHYCK